jgi:hypothetical protein
VNKGIVRNFNPFFGRILLLLVLYFSAWQRSVVMGALQYLSEILQSQCPSLTSDWLNCEWQLHAMVTLLCRWSTSLALMGTSLAPHIMVYGFDANCSNTPSKLLTNGILKTQRSLTYTTLHDI